MVFIKRSFTLLCTCMLVPHLVLAYESSSKGHPFYMSPEINAETVRAMSEKGEGEKLTEETVGIGKHQPAKDFKKVKVIEVITADDFSYLQVESTHKKFWIAGINVSAKTGDYIQYVDNVTMHDFKSKALNRVFDQVMFVSEVSVLSNQ